MLLIQLKRIICFNKRKEVSIWNIIFHWFKKVMLDKDFTTLPNQLITSTAWW